LNTGIRINEPGVKKYAPLVALRFTPKQREEITGFATAAGYSSLSAFFYDLAKQAATDSTASLSLVERDFESKSAKATEIAKRLGLRKHTILTNLYRAAARDMGYDSKFFTKPLRRFPEDYERIVSKVFKQVMNTEDSPIDTLDLVQFKKLFALWKDISDLEEKIHAQAEAEAEPASAVVVASPGAGAAVSAVSGSSAQS
jgi:hypothetical protein